MDGAKKTKVKRIKHSLKNTYKQVRMKLSIMYEHDELWWFKVKVKVKTDFIVLHKK